MATIVNRRRGTTAQHAGFTGAIAETTYDTDKKVSVVHDAVTPGGFPLAAQHLAQTWVPSQTFANTENFFGSTANGAPVAKFLSTPGAGFSTLDFNANGTPDLNFLRKYNSTPFQIELAGSGGIDLVIDSNNNETGTSVRFLTNAIRGGVQTTLFTVFDNGAVTITGPVSFPDGITQVFNPNGTNSGFNVGANAVDPSAPVNGDIWYQSTANELRARINGATVALGAGGASPPFVDTNPLVMGSADATKLMRFEVDGFTTATTRVLTPPNADITLAGINIAQTFAEDQTFGKRILLPDTTSATVGGIYFGGVAAFHNFGTDNTFAGVDAGNFTMGGINNSFFGVNAGSGNGAGDNNSFFGVSAGSGNDTGDNNSFFGLNAGGVNSTGSNNSYFGVAAGNNADGSNNILFGYRAGNNLTSGSNNIVIGYDIDSPTDTNSNTLTLGNLIFGTGVDGTGTTISSGNVGIAVITPTSGLHLGRSFAAPYRATAVTTTFLASDYTIDCTSGTFTVNLPTAVGITGRLYAIKNSGVGTITIDPAGAELIDGSATATVVAGSAFMVQSSGTGWIIL